MSKIFVAGATGNIGTALLAQLQDTDVEVVAGVHDPDKMKPFAESGVEARLFDYKDPDSISRAMQGCDRMFFALPFTEKMGHYGHLVVEAAKASGIEYIVRSSGYAASSDAHWRLGREHGMVDQFVEDSGIPFTVLRPNTFMQYFSTSLAEMVKTGVIALPEEDACVSYIDVRDIAACAARLLLDNEGHVENFYALTGPEGLGLAEVAETIAKAAGREVKYLPVPEEEFVAALQEMGMEQWNINMLVSLSRVVKLGMAGNVTHAVSYLTDTPARTFADFAKECSAVWK